MTWIFDMFAWLLAAVLLIFTLRRFAFMLAAWLPSKPIARRPDGRVPSVHAAGSGSKRSRRNQGDPRRTPRNCLRASLKQFLSP
jgi:hypothetical protein